jgi:hypothetical protein
VAIIGIILIVLLSTFPIQCYIFNDCHATAKEKKPSNSSPFDTPIRPAAALSNQGCRFHLSVQNRWPTEGTAMLIQSVYQLYSFSKKDCPQHGSVSGKKMYYTM